MNPSAIVVTGAGGVGKTTVAAALGIGLAGRGARTLVLTVDPARRLADALAIEQLGDDPQSVPGIENLWSSMLDVASSWEALLHRYADPEVADRLLENPYFRAIADRFPAAQSFAAAEAMAELIESGHWERVIVDTPPSAGGLDFFLSPRRMGDLVGGKLLRWLTGARLPARQMLYRITARPVLKLADTVLGGPLLEDVAEFLLDLRTMYDGLASRARTIERHLQRASTMIVTTADPAPMHETLRFFEELGTISVHPSVVLFNRALPLTWSQARPIRAADIPDAAARTRLAANLARWGGESRRQADARAVLRDRFDVPIATAPWLARPPTAVADLAALIEATRGLPWDAPPNP